MSKNIPDSCYINDLAAPWNDIEVFYTYRIQLKVDNILFVSGPITESVDFAHFTIKNEDDYVYMENDLYVIIEDNLPEEIKDYEYEIELLD